MFVLSFRFLTGRYHATQWGRNVNEGIVDWPPSPWRILRAIIATWKKTSKDIQDDKMWPILENIAKSKVSFYLPKATQSHTRHYMPVFGGKKTSKIIDSFMVINPQELVMAIWENVELDQKQKEIIDNIIKKISYFGRAESWCEVKRMDNAKAYNCVKLERDIEVKDANIVRVLMPDKNVTLKDLCIETREMHDKKILDPPNSQWVKYVLPKDQHTNEFKSVQKPVNVIRYRIAGNVCPKITESLRIGSLFRKIAMSIYGKENQNETSQIFSGKQKDGKHLKDNHNHAFFLPTDEDGDNILDHLTIVARQPFDEKEISVLAKIGHGRYGQNRFSLIYQGRGMIEEFDRVPSLQKAKKWRSFTPFVLNRHVKMRGKGVKHIVDGPEDQLRLEIKRRFGDTTTIKNIKINNSTSTMKCNLKPIQFKRWRKDKMSGFGAYDVSIEFDEKIQGPLSFGHAAHFGLGLFIPDNSNRTD